MLSLLQINTDHIDVTIDRTEIKSLRSSQQISLTNEDKISKANRKIKKTIEWIRLVKLIRKSGKFHHQNNERG